MDKLNLRPSALDKSSLITIGTKFTNGEKCALNIVNAAIPAAKQYLANLGLIPSNCSTGISVEYTLSKSYSCRIVFRFYSKCSLEVIDRYAERIQRDLTAILCYYRSMAVMDLKLKSMEKDLLHKVSTIRKDLGFLDSGDGIPSCLVKMRTRSKAFGCE